MTGLDAKGMRQANSGALLRILHQSVGPISLAALAARTGLSRRTVELILNALENDGWVRTPSQELHASGRGRPARLFEFRPDAGAVLTVDVEHHRSTAQVTDLQGRPMGKAVTLISGEPGRRDRLELTRDAITDVLTEVALEPADIGAVTIATPGNVDDDGVVAADLSMRQWRGVNLRDELCGDFGCPVVVENNAKLAMLAELSEGAAVGADHMLWLMLEGVHNGMGILVNGMPYRGVRGAAGEIFWAKVLGLDAIAGSPLNGLGRLQSRQQQADSRELVRRAQAGDEQAVAVVDEFASILARALSTLCWVLAPRYVILGGTLSHAVGDLLVARVAQHLDGQAPDFVDLRLSLLGPDAVLRGAVRSALGSFDWASRPALSVASPRRAQA
ncbi:ROK family transcriptional regulator [soil metagenome]